MMKYSKMVRFFSIAGTVIFFISGHANAENIRDFGDKIPTQEEFIRALKPKVDDGALQYHPRGIRPLKSQTEREEIGASIELNFDFDSDRLTPKAKTIIDNLGGALQTEELKNFAFRIEGHTDSMGNERYNMGLSERRAHSVKKYLVEKFNVDFNNLKTVGKGESDLLDPLHPDSAKNRRVQILNIGG